MRRFTLLIAIALLLAACSSEEPLEGIDLPPAAVPDDVGETWAVLFTHDFAPGSWDQGDHAYELALACDVIVDEPVRSQPLTFTVAPADLIDQPVYLRIVGLSVDLMGPPNVGMIDPRQPTTAALTIIGASEADAKEAAQTCAGAIFYDDAEPLPLFPQPAFRP